ncbi:uncharacterized protein LOC134238498 isoform X1 [Saccostrea cucullata]|uniref:uncharacterized protein LOC134238498 isoform X1 n=1 Tax=Saccostrea cuccullata TaxID=36930 RepID=UPI002ED69592
MSRQHSSHSSHSRPGTVIPVCTSATNSRVSQLQQESGINYAASRTASSPSAEFQPGPSQWPRNPPSASVWRSQECGYVEQANQQYNLEQQQQYHTLQPASTSAQGYVRRPDSPIVWECPEPRSGMPIVTRVGLPSLGQSAFVQLHSQPPQQQPRGPSQLTPQQTTQRPLPPQLSAQQSQHSVTQDSLSQYLNADDSVNINNDIDLSALVPNDDIVNNSK